MLEPNTHTNQTQSGPSTLCDWHTDLDIIYAAAIGTRDPQQTKIRRTIDSESGRTTAIHATIPDPRSPWANTSLILFNLTYAPDKIPGNFHIQSWAIRITDDANLTELAMLAARFEPPVIDSVLTPTLRPAKRAKPGAMSDIHSAHRVWQLAVNRAASAALTGYPLSKSIPGVHLNQATHYSRLKANGVINGERFTFELTRDQQAYLRLHNPDATVSCEFGPASLSDVGLAEHDSSDTKLSTLLAHLAGILAK